MMSKTILKKLIEIAGEKSVLIKSQDIEAYSHDELAMPKVKVLPDYVVKPQNAKQVSQILALANKEDIAVTARGGATGLCGGCVPVSGGIVLSLERMNKLLEIDKENKVAIVEAGITLCDFYKAIEREGLFFPPHPGDESSQIGGIIATNAGGSRAVKYGVARNYVRGLEVVLADGRIVQFGGKISKNSSGYSLLNLLIGSEGTLAVITKATIALVPLPIKMATLLVPFSNISAAISAVPKILQSGIVPMAVEFMESDMVDYAKDKLGYKFPYKGAAAYLLIIIDAKDEGEADDICQKLADVCLKNNADDVFIADSSAKQKELLDFRGKFYDVLKPDMIEDLDLVVPVSEITQLIEYVHQLEKKYNIWLATYGHAADGNVHVHIMRKPFDPTLACGEYNIPHAEACGTEQQVKREIYKKTKELGGMLSGEHGIGFIKVKELPEFVGETQIELMKKIKKAFDPKGILNPGKMLKY
jgi:glycolate oxidase